MRTMVGTGRGLFALTTMTAMTAMMAMMASTSPAFAEGEGQPATTTTMTTTTPPADPQKPTGDAWDTAIKQGMHQEGRPSQAELDRREREKADVDEYEVGRKVGIGGDLLFLVPVGDISDATGPMIGPVFRAGYRLKPQIEITGRLGALFGLATTETRGSTEASSQIHLVPVWLGARFFFMKEQAPAGVYAGAEMGANILIAGRTITGTFGGATTKLSDDATNARFGTNFAVGYVISRELPLDIRGQFSLLNLFDGGALGYGAGLSAGYTFSL